VRLRVVHGLNAVLDDAQIPIRRRQRSDGGRRQLPIAGKERQYRQQRACAQLRPAAAAYDLKRLHDELDLADAAWTELDVLGQVLARDFLGDEPLHLPKRVEYAVVQVAAIDERRQDIVEDVRGELDTREQPRLDVCVSLPVAAVLDEVRFERRKPDCERAARAERAQPHVDAICEAVLGALIEQLDEQLAEAKVVSLRLDLDAALDGSVGVEEHQVDVRREVQLDAAELTHTEHEQWQLAAVRVSRPPEPRLEACRGIAQRSVDEALGKERHVGERRVELGDAGEVSPRDARHLDVASAPQGRHRLRQRVVAGR
jgi:hypothetical protein